MDMEYMDATLQVNAFGMTAGCTFCLDNLPNQLAVLGHFRAILEMCHNQCEGDPDQYDRLQLAATLVATSFPFARLYALHQPH
ncbi:unnamed protein product [Symbiodinium natans]|uniref:Uncharacterized protein n=1 Tax=Symbiodinium natans TaxID=878477 RepID=A0A812I3U9_9DINO|nr:unnamed protein product [Symbiodinium natans]